MNETIADTTDTAESAAVADTVDTDAVTLDNSRLVGAIGLSLAALLAACGGGTNEGPPKPALDLFDFTKSTDQPDLLTPHNTTRQTAGPNMRAKAAAVPTASQFMDWAEATYPNHFPPHQKDVTYSGSDPGYAGLSYRFYPQTNNYLLVWNGLCFVMGALSNGNLAQVGTLSSFAEAVGLAPPAGGASSDFEAARFLQHASFSSLETDIAAVRQKGYEVWLNEQMALPLGQTGREWLIAHGYAEITVSEFFFNSVTAQHMIWYQFITSPDAVRKRWSLALSEIFVIAMDGIMNLNWQNFVVADYWDTLNRNAFGNFRNLLEEITLNPAMGTFLNTLDNQKEDLRSGRLPDENYAREVMQLFTIGLNLLNIDGTPKLGVSGQPQDSYQQADVSNLARVFTGYTIYKNAAGVFSSPKPPFARVENLGYLGQAMAFDASRHSNLEVNFLGINIPAGTPGPAALKIALDGLFDHPNVGPFFARQMIQRLVTGNPNPTYVARVARAFNNNGDGVRGDMKSVLKAILLDPDAIGIGGLTDPTFGKLREPMLRIAQWGRTFKVNSIQGTWKFTIYKGDPRNYLGQQPLNPGSVFNFFRPGYVPPSTAMAAIGATAPEFQIVNDTSVASYVNFLGTILWNGLWVRAPELNYFPEKDTPTDGNDIVPDYSAELALVLDDSTLVRRLNLLLCAGQLSAETQALIVNALAIDRVAPSTGSDGKRAHVMRALLFVMSSAEYLIQK
jgi:uncharacterized protein (DUF1800 family)